LISSGEVLLILALAPFVGAVLSGISTGRLRTRPYMGWFAAGAVFAAAGASLLPAMNGPKPAFAMLLGLTLGCVAGIAVCAVAEFLWPRERTNMRGGGRAKPVRAARNGANLAANTLLAILLVAFSMGVVYSAKNAESMAGMLSLAVELFWLAFAVGAPAVRLATRATTGLLLAVIALLGQILGMAVTEGLTGTYLVASLALGFGAAMYVAVHPLLADLGNTRSEPRVLTASFLAGYGAALVLVAFV
jgi:hypothetical protein